MTCGEYVIRKYGVYGHHRRICLSRVYFSLSAYSRVPLQESGLLSFTPRMDPHHIFASRQVSQHARCMLIANPIWV
jgi:hypothetical protein